MNFGDMRFLDMLTKFSENPQTLSENLKFAENPPKCGEQTAKFGKNTFSKDVRRNFTQFCLKVT